MLLDKRRSLVGHIAAILGWDIERGREMQICDGRHGMDAQSTTESATTELATTELATTEPPVTEPVATEASAAEQAETNSLEAVELELALHNQNLVSLGFEESIRTALQAIGGEILFQMRLENEDCQRVAAVRIGNEGERQFALVIMPPDGGLMRVEPVEQSSNPIAKITESYAGLMDVFRAAA
jgi:hypothetical protein